MISLSLSLSPAGLQSYQDFMLLCRRSMEAKLNTADAIGWHNRPSSKRFMKKKPCQATGRLRSKDRIHNDPKVDVLIGQRLQLTHQAAKVQAISQAHSNRLQHRLHSMSGPIGVLQDVDPRCAEIMEITHLRVKHPQHVGKSYLPTIGLGT